VADALVVLCAPEAGAAEAGAAAAQLRESGVARLAVFVGDETAALAELLTELHR
jgi:hypothetical protein